MKFVPQQAPSPFTQQRPHHSRMVLPRWGRGSNDWVTPLGSEKGSALQNKHRDVLRHRKRGKVMILNTWTLFFHAHGCLFHQHMRWMLWHQHQTTSCIQQGHCQSSPWYKGQKKETFAASSLVILCCVFLSEHRPQLFHTQPAKGWNFISTDTDFSTNHQHFQVPDSGSLPNPQSKHSRLRILLPSPRLEW